MQKKFDEWNQRKKKTENRKVGFLFKERDIFLTSIGVNIGHESCGKGGGFLRPVLVYKKISATSFLGIPLSTTKKTGSYYFKFSFTKKIESTALLHQIRIFDVRRVERKIGMASFHTMTQLKEQFLSVYGDNKNSPPDCSRGGIPKEKVTSLYKHNVKRASGSLILLAHNIRSLWNVGSLFRSADAFNVQKIYLTGYTGTPPRREIHKTALGADEWIDWEYEKNPIVAIEQLKEEGYKIVALELTDNAVDIRSYQAEEKTCLILGNEVLGVPKELLRIADDVMYIPMGGKKESLNVSVAAGIAMYQLASSINLAS